MTRFLPLLGLLALTACSDSTEDPTDPTDPVDTGETPDTELLRAAAEGASWGSNVTVTVTDDSIVIESDGLPNHDVLDEYAPFDDGDVVLVEAVATTVTIPLVPEAATDVTETSLGAIGIAISGAVFFNPYEGDGTTVALDDNFVVDGNPFIDDCNGHPTPTNGQYHYHGIPTCITATLDTAGEHSRLLGYLLDGYPVYGPQDVDGEAPSDLDACLGHFGPTPEFPDGVYHYHTTNSAPYISPCYAGAVDATMGMGGPPDGGMPPGP